MRPHGRHRWPHAWAPFIHGDRSIGGGHAHHQLAVAHAHVQGLADGEAQFLHPAAAQAQRRHGLAAGGLVDAADGAALRRARAAWGALLARKLGGVGRGDLLGRQHGDELGLDDGPVRAAGCLARGMLARRGGTG